MGSHFIGTLATFFVNVAKVHKQFPETVLLATEATYEKHRWAAGTTESYADWSFGEGYAHDIIGDLNSGSAGWIDWNLLLKRDGGPNHVGNVCDAAAIADFPQGTVEYHPQYYYIGQFSKYILPGSRRLWSTVVNTTRYAGPLRPYGTCNSDDGLQAIAALRPDSQVVVVVLNCGISPVTFKIKDGSRALSATIPPHGIQTYVYPMLEIASV